MPSLTSGADRLLLSAGDNMLGGDISEMVASAPVANVTPVAKVTVFPDGTATIARIVRRAVVRVNKRNVGVTPLVLRHGARVDIGRHRFAYDAAPMSEPAPRRLATTPVASSNAVTVLLAAPVIPPAPQESARSQPVSTPLPPPLALLEVTRGKLAGERWRIDRAVSTLGRGVENDVRVADHSVSTSHATLLLKGDDWFLVDLRSSNGTHVDGHRISGERALVRGSTIRLGAVELTFTPTASRRPPASSTRHVAGFAERFSKLW
ncbi:MAG: FHA domain-containing protein [Gemmatimonadaceae bacterium]|nr:FHA domain-containing protein [Gemmatimonadaceae bacterium]